MVHLLLFVPPAIGALLGFVVMRWVMLRRRNRAGQRIINLADPSSLTDAVTKQYVDNNTRVEDLPDADG